MRPAFAGEVIGFKARRTKAGTIVTVVGTRTSGNYGQANRQAGKAVAEVSDDEADSSPVPMTPRTFKRARLMSTRVLQTNPFVSSLRVAHRPMTGVRRLRSNGVASARVSRTLFPSQNVSKSTPGVESTTRRRRRRLQPPLSPDGMDDESKAGPFRSGVVEKDGEDDDEQMRVDDSGVLSTLSAAVLSNGQQPPPPPSLAHVWQRLTATTPRKASPGLSFN